MFIIRNTTDRDVVLDDLRVILGPKKQIDLDRVAARHLIDASPKLRMAFQQQRVATIAKDGDQIVPVKPTVSDDVLQKMEERLKADFKLQLAALTRAMPKPANSDNASVSALMDTIKQLTAQLKSQPHTTPTDTKLEAEDSSSPANSASTSDGISDDISSKIHAKNMKRLEGTVTSHVEQESKIISDKSVTNNVDELEGLL